MATSSMFWTAYLNAFAGTKALWKSLGNFELMRYISKLTSVASVQAAVIIVHYLSHADKRLPSQSGLDLLG
jgi:hypothetical protein